MSESYAPEADHEFNRLLREERPAADWVRTSVEYDRVHVRDYLQVWESTARGGPVERLVRLRIHIDTSDREHSLDAARHLAQAFIDEFWNKESA